MIVIPMTQLFTRDQMTQTLTTIGHHTVISFNNVLFVFLILQLMFRERLSRQYQQRHLVSQQTGSLFNDLLV